MKKQIDLKEQPVYWFYEGVATEKSMGSALFALCAAILFVEEEIISIVP